MIHLQKTVPNWTEAVQLLPDHSLVKVIDQGQLFQVVKSINNNIYTCLRHHYDRKQVFGGSYDENIQRAKDFFNSFIDETFKTQIAPYTDFVEEWNEYLADTQNEQEVEERVTWCRAACEVWDSFFRSDQRLSHIRLALCNTAVGNSIPSPFFHLANTYNNLLAYHPYIYSTNNQRSQQDWPWHSGRYNLMEEQVGVKVNWIFTEAGPYESAVDGWRSNKCLSGDREKYVSVVKDWIDDVKKTPAYTEERIYGFALFTTGRAGNTWKHYYTEQPELNQLATMINTEWKQQTTPNQPPPQPPPNDIDKGQPRIQYTRVVNVIPSTSSNEEAEKIFKVAWKTGRQTVTGSYDDAGVGNLDNKTAILWDIPLDQQDSYKRFFQLHYPTTTVLFFHLAAVVSNSHSITQPITYPIKNVTHLINVEGHFNTPRPYGPHEGLDLYGSLGDSVIAVMNGLVTWASSNKRSDGKPSKYGNHVIIEHDNNLISWYCHLQEITILTGSKMLEGEEIGLLGSTGTSTAPHLHFNLQNTVRGLDGYIIENIIDPTPYLF